MGDFQAGHVIPEVSRWSFANDSTCNKDASETWALDGSLSRCSNPITLILDTPITMD